MYYEEKIIDGVLHWRSRPDDDWTAYTVEELSRKVVQQKDALRAVREAPVVWMSERVSDPCFMRETQIYYKPTDRDGFAPVRLVPVGEGERNDGGEDER